VAPVRRILVETGLRFGEAAELRWSDVDLGARMLRVERALPSGTRSPAAV
jgi:integrase